MDKAREALAAAIETAASAGDIRDVLPRLLHVTHDRTVVAAALVICDIDLIRAPDDPLLLRTRELLLSAVGTSAYSLGWP
jgi:hypothetical protein